MRRSVVKFCCLCGACLYGALDGRGWSGIDGAMKFGCANGEYEAIARKDQQLNIHDKIIIEMCGESLWFFVLVVVEFLLLH
jgi:hypothetical protein